MRVLVVGGGGREHALAWAMARSPAVDDVVCAPGNPGMAGLGRCFPIDVADAAAIARMADDLACDLTVVGPEVPLVHGAVDAVRARGRLAFGPTAAAARLEGSKAWMKDVLVDAGVATAMHGSFTALQRDEALAFLRNLRGLYVLKTDGLAAGKGVVVTESLTEAEAALDEYLSGRAFGDAGQTIVIEEGLSGPELSLLVLTDGMRSVALEPAQDFKRVGDGDTGPNTGGMGAYSPVPMVDAALVDHVMDRAIEPTLALLRRRGIEYRGVLYAGLMLTPDGPKVLEYNVRFGDPECEALVPRLTSDVFEHCHEVASGRMIAPPTWTARSCVSVVLAVEGYPGSPRVGDVITGLDDVTLEDGTPDGIGVSDDAVTVFHAGTARRTDGTLVTAGGRVLVVSALASSIDAARSLAYARAQDLQWPGRVMRCDIAASAASEEPSSRLTPRLRGESR